MNGAFALDIMEYERKEKVGYMSGAVKKRLLSLLLAVSMIVGNTGQVLAQESAVLSEETAGNLLSAEPKGLSLEEEDREVISESEEGISEQEEVKVNSGTESLPEQMQEGNSENYIEKDDETEEASEDSFMETEGDFIDGSELEEEAAAEEESALLPEISTLSKGQSDLPAVENLTVIEDDFEQVKLNWTYPVTEDLVEFRVYRSEDGGFNYLSEYESVTKPMGSSSTEYYIYTDAPLDPDTGNNGSYVYMVVPVDREGRLGTEATIENKGGSVGVDDEDTVVTGITFVDENGNPLEKLSLHVGEAGKAGLAFTKEDGTIASMVHDSFLKDFHAWMDVFEAGYSFSIDWELKVTTGEVRELDLYPADYSTSDIDWLFTKEVVEAKEAYLHALRMSEEGKRYFMEARVTGPFMGTETYRVRLPIEVLPAEEGVTYELPDTLEVVNNMAEVEQGIRDLMAGRKDEDWVITEDVEYPDADKILDTFEEREGMQPWEGDYLRYAIGYRDALSGVYSHLEGGSFYYKGDYYTTYRHGVPFITTAEEEAQVNERIQELIHTPGGELYSYAYGENVTTEEKIQAIYNWIVKNVSGSVSGDRRTPIYHTAYHALIKGSGTCEAFALLFSRFSREMGIPSKVIMGVDASAHAYNIVQVGQKKWMYIDTSAKKYLADANSFQRADEQEHYKNPLFIKNYLSKVPGSPYIEDAEGVAVVTSSVDSVGESFEKLKDAMDYIVEQVESGEDPDVAYTITLTDGDMYFPSDGMMFYGENMLSHGDRISIDLGGNMLRIMDGVNPATLMVKKVSNGTIGVGNSASFRIFATADMGEVTYEDLDIVYYSKANISNPMPMLWITAEGESKVTLKNSVTIEKFYSIFLEGNVEVNCELQAEEMELGGEIYPDAVVCLNKKVTAEESLKVWCGTIYAETLISKKKLELQDPGNTFLFIGKELKVLGSTILQDIFDNTQVTVSLEQAVQEGKENPVPKATLTWEGTIERRGGDGTISPMIALCAHYEEEGEEIKARGFYGGDILGRISLKAQNPVTYKYDMIISSDNYDDYLDIEIDQPEKYFAEIENQTLSIVGLSIAVQQGEDGTPQKFSSLKKAIDGLSKVAGGAAGTYIFMFTENTVLSTNMTLPDYVKEAVFEKQEAAGTENIEIDMKGYSLTSKGSFTVKEGVLLNSTGSGNGSLVTNKVTSENDYGIRLYAPIEKINVKAVNAAVWLEENQNIQIISGEVTAKNLVTEGNWKVMGKVTNTSIENLGTLVLDTLVQTSKNKTVLNQNSKLVVLTKADLYHVEVKQPVSGTKAAIYREEEADLSMNGNFSIKEKGLGFGILSKEDNKDGILYNDVVDFTSKQKLFTTSSKSFPILSIDLKQASADPKYTVLLQKGTEILAAGEWFVLKEVADGREQRLGSFADWKTVTEYITSLSDSSAVYVIEIMDHIVLEEKLALPTKAGKIILRGTSSEELIKLTYLDDLQLTANLEIENLKLEAEKYNSKTKTNEPYFSAVKLSGKNLTMKNSTAEFSSITGTNTSYFEIEGEKEHEIIVRKAIKTLQEIKIEGANLNVGRELKLTEAAVSAVKDVSMTEGKLVAESGTVTLTGTLTMKDGALEGSSKLELNHIISNSNQNRIVYGGNTKADGCTIKGQISSTIDQGQQENKNYRKNAIDLTVKSLEQGYQQGQLLLTGPKVQGSWFVVGSSFEEGQRSKVQFETYKEGTSIYCGTAEETGAVLLAYDQKSGAYVTYDSYPTLQKALDEIVQIADKTVNYRIVLAKDSVGNTMLTTPAYANSLQLLGKESGTKLHVDKGITLKGTTVLEGLTLVPGTKATLTLGDYSLRMTGCEVEGNSFSSISGSGTTKASVLELQETELYAAGTVKGIGTLILDNAGVTAEQDLTIGNLLQTEGKTGSLTATATVTRKNNEITKIVPKLTIEGYAVLGGNGIDVTLRELSNKQYQILDLRERTETAAVREAGIPFIKGAYLSTDQITLSEECVGDETGKGITKKSGHLVYDPVEKTGALLIYRDQNDVEIRTKVGGLKEAVEEIDSQKKKRDYTILLYKGVGESLTLEKTLPMPKSSSMSSLTLEGEFEAEASKEELLQLPLNGGITLTAPTTFKNLSFVKKDAEDYPAATVLSMAGNDLAVEGKVVINTPLAINGGNKGSLIFGEEGQLVTLTNKSSFPEKDQEQLIHGTITGIKKLSLKEGQSFILKDYETISGTKRSRTSATLTVTEVYSEGEIKIQGEGAKQKVKIDSAVLTGGSLYSSGSIEMNVLRLSGETSVRAKTDFTIKKTLYSDTKDGALYTSIKEGKTPAPYLKIDGNVILEKEGEHKVKIGVYKDTFSEEFADLLDIGSTGQLLTASKAGIGMFTAAEENVKNLGVYSVTNPAGYLLKKTGSAINVCDGVNAAVALCLGEQADGDVSKASVIYYTDLKDVAEEINNRKNKEETYTIILLKNVNSSTVPIAMTLPSMAEKVIITSLKGQQYGWYYTGNISLKTDTEFKNIIFYPMKSSEKPTLSSFTTGTYDLILRNIMVGDMEGMGIKDISGNAKQTTILSADGIRFSGNVQNSGTLILEKSAIIEGKVKASLVILESGTEEYKNTAAVTGSFQADRLTMRGNTELVGKNTITITNLSNEKGEDSFGNGENMISYGTDSKGGGQLTLKGMVEGHNDMPISLSMTAANKTSEDYRIIQDPKTLKYQTSDNKKLAVFEKEDPSKITILLNGQTLDRDKITVMSKGVYLLP